jgi:hypothetical protein
MSTRQDAQAGSTGLVLAILTLIPTGPIAAQRQAPTQYPRYQAAFPAPLATRPDTRAHATQDSRWTGVAVGAVSFGALGAWLGAGFCGMRDDTSRSCLGAAVTGMLSVGTIGAILGGVVGTGIKRAPAPPPPADSLRLRTAPSPRRLPGRVAGRRNPTAGSTANGTPTTSARDHSRAPVFSAAVRGYSTSASSGTGTTPGVSSGGGVGGTKPSGGSISISW